MSSEHDKPSSGSRPWPEARSAASTKDAPPPLGLLAVDLDGTLLDSQNRVPPENRAALHRAHEAGMVVCLTTGRCYKETRRVIEEIGLDLDVTVTVFGAIVSEAGSGRTIHAAPIPPEPLDRCCRFLARQGLSFVLLHDGTAADTDYTVIRGERWHPGYDRWKEMVSCTFREAGHWDDARETVYRVTFIETPDALRAMEPDLNAALPPSLLKSNAIYVHPYDVHVLEFFAPQVNKWYGLLHLCRDYRIAPERVVAIGDSINDLEMIQQAGLSFAMSNGDERIIQAAMHTAPGNDEAGVAWAVNRTLDHHW
jgi:Cof subfamily protein (haloacid dehalogenase superfamily)